MQGQSPQGDARAMARLLGKFDLDPGRWRPLSYTTQVQVPVAQNGVGRNSINLNNQPFIMTRIGHQILGDTAKSSTSGLYQDGQYTIEWKDEQSVYQNEAVPANLLGGSVASGFAVNLSFPIPYAGNKTLTFTVENQVTRALTPESDYFVVAISVFGVADWGELQVQGR